MRTMWLHASVIACLLALCVPAAADVTVTRLSGPTTYSVDQLQEVEGKWRVFITAEVSSTPMVLAVEAGDSNDIIEYVRCDVDDPGTLDCGRVELVIRSANGARLTRVEEVTYQDPDPSETDGELWIQLLRTSLTSGSTDGNIGTAGTTPGGTIIAHRVLELDAAGHITASIDTNFGICGNSTGGTIDLVHADGSIYGSIYAAYDIGRIEADGDIGPITIRSGALQGSGEGNTIANVAGDMVYAAIWAGEFGHSAVHRIESREGSFHGSLSCSDFSASGTGDPGLFSEADITADMRLDDFNTGEIVAAGDLTANGRIVILGDYSLESHNAITLGEDGLKGQVIINAADEGGTWGGGIVVGAITLSPSESQPDRAPSYNRSAAALGGGAVGLVPFDLHGADCTPERCGVVATVPDNEVVLRFYGPITWDEEEMPVTVEIGLITNWDCPPPSATNWTDVTSDFTVAERDPQKPRELVVYPMDPTVHYVPGLVYRIMPVREGDGALKCEVGDEPLVKDFAYYVFVDD